MTFYENYIMITFNASSQKNIFGLLSKMGATKKHINNQIKAFTNFINFFFT